MQDVVETARLLKAAIAVDQTVADKMSSDHSLSAAFFESASDEEKGQLIEKSIQLMLYSMAFMTQAMLTQEATDEYEEKSALDLIANIEVVAAIASRMLDELELRKSIPSEFRNDRISGGFDKIGAPYLARFTKEHFLKLVN